MTITPEHKHCWHETSRAHTTAGTSIMRKCCHCGVIEQELIPPFLDDRDYTYRDKDHGPFVDNKPRWTP